jgi:hypothetical protein
MCIAWDYSRLSLVHLSSMAQVHTSRACGCAPTHSDPKSSRAAKVTGEASGDARAGQRAPGGRGFIFTLIVRLNTSFASTAESSACPLPTSSPTRRISRRTPIPQHQSRTPSNPTMSADAIIEDLEQGNAIEIETLRKLKENIVAVCRYEITDRTR